MIQVVNQLFINCTIIIASVTFANMLMRDKFYNPSKRNSLINGFLSGVLGIVLMLYSVSITQEIILDFRFIPIVIVALYASFTSSVLAAFMIALFRVIYFGVNDASIVSAFVTMMIGIGCGFFGRLNTHILKKWVLSLILICVGSSIGLALVIHDSFLLSRVVMVFLSCMAVVFFLMFVFVEYIRDSNRKYFKMKDETEKDFLTDLYNARHLGNALEKHINKSLEEQKSLSLLFIDIDHFKEINDHHGHLNGDLVLMELGKILTNMARSKDIINRKGGEEFTVLLVGCNLAQACAVAERIRKAVESHDFRFSRNISARITVSIGVSSIPETTTIKDTLMDQADRALYRAKRAGRNRIEIAGDISSD